MKLTINGVSVSFDKIPKEIVFNNGEVTIINDESTSSKEDVCVSEYTIDNPKLVDCYFDFRDQETFTGIVKDKDNTIAYYLNGKLHREDGPAVAYANGTKEWCLNGKLHREDAPAVELASGDKEWWFNGEHYGWNFHFNKESWIAFVATLK